MSDHFHPDDIPCTEGWECWEPPCDFCDRPAGYETLGGHYLCAKHEEIYWRHVNSKIDAARGK